MFEMFKSAIMSLSLILTGRLAFSRQLILARGPMPPRGPVVHGGPAIQRGLVFPRRVIARSIQARSIQSGLLALLAVGWHRPALAGVMGAASPIPYPVAVERSRQAARAVLERRGTESCLRGKLSGALLVLSASCEAEARQTPLCALAEQVAVTSDWRSATMDASSKAILAQPP
jgi:hypothetical protein